MVETENPSPKSNNQTESDQPTKKKRNLPGMPDPEAEVIALSPKALMATNRFVCEICNKGFQRDQNLQLHRRGHNLPWKLRQRSDKEVRRRVYVCPEPTCIHHDPARALGDLTGIKKHFCRKHGDKKYKCERCSKKYAVQSDWKAHMKVCGTREYRCDCGTLFSRRDSFITHRAFCDALAQESARPQPMSSDGDGKVRVVEQLPPASSPPPPPLTPSTGVLSPVLSIQSLAELPENQTAPLQSPPPPITAALSTSTAVPSATTTTNAAASSSSNTSSHVPKSGGVLPSILNASSNSGLLCTMVGSDHPAIDPVSLSLSSSLYGASSLFQSASQNPRSHYASSALSATALLQKAAQIGATSSNSSFLQGLWLSTPSPSDVRDNAPTMDSMASSTPSHANINDGVVKLEKNSMESGLGLGLRSSGFGELMMSDSGFFANKPTTLDFLGLGMGGGDASAGGISAFLSSIGGGLDMAATASFAGVRPAGDDWDEPAERKSSIL